MAYERSTCLRASMEMAYACLVQSVNPFVRNLKLSIKYKQSRGICYGGCTFLRPKAMILSDRSSPAREQLSCSRLIDTLQQWVFHATPGNICQVCSGVKYQNTTQSYVSLLFGDDGCYLVVSSVARSMSAWLLLLFLRVILVGELFPLISIFFRAINSWCICPNRCHVSLGTWSNQTPAKKHTR